MKTFDLSLYLVLDPGLCGDLGIVATACEAVAGGATLVQLRDKHASTSDLVAAGHALKRALAGGDARLIVNDDVEAAVLIGADGVHIGQDDADPARARDRIGPNMILGVSVETEALARAVDPALVDYVGVGPVFATATKPGHKEPVGLDGLARLVTAAPVPAVAIGGLKLGHVESVLATGAQGLAVASAICGQDNPRRAAEEIAKAIARARP